MTDAMPWMIAKNAQGKGIMGCKTAGLQEIGVWDPVGKDVLTKAPLPPLVFLTEDGCGLPLRGWTRASMHFNSCGCPQCSEHSSA